MRVIVLAAALAVGCAFVDCSAAFSQEQRILLTPAQTRAYHDCLTAAWLLEYCQTHAWGAFGSYDRTKAECLAADRADVFALRDRRYFENNESYCWNQAHRIAR